MRDQIPTPLHELTIGRRLLRLVGIWTVPYVVFTTLGLTNLDQSPDLLRYYAAHMVGWFYWVPVTLLVSTTVRRGPPSLATMPRYIGIGLLVCLFYCVAFAVTMRLEGTRDETLARTVLMAVQFASVSGLFIYSLIVAVIAASDQSRRARSETLRSSQLEVQLANARLEGLQARLRPHFLFNSLHAIAGLVRGGEPDRAVDLLARLSNLLRAAFERADRHEIALSDELALLEEYLAIERARFGDRLTVTLEIEEATREALVPPLLLQPLMENAVRHGIAAVPGPGQVQFASVHQNGRLDLTIRNTGPRLDEVSFHGADGEGLNNTRQRLAVLFGDNHSFVIVPGSQGGAVVEISIPFHTAEEEAS